ncbi:magnesium transporter [Opitutaceae bacterium EW11]|nr:magnesium transporter [Opitutaceae bacterium EW11]
MISSLVYRDSKLSAVNPPPETLAILRTEPGVMIWVDLSAPTDSETKLILEQTFAFHQLAIEDCVSDSPFPKLEPYDDYLYLVMHAVDYRQDHVFSTTELDLFIGKNFLVTYHREPLRPVDASLDRFSKSPTIVVRGPDRFAHTILDFMIEAYKPALDALHRQIEGVESGVLSGISAPELFPQVVGLRKQLSQLRQIVRPQREIIVELAQGKYRLIRSVILPYLRDLSEEMGRIENQATGWSEQLILSFRIFLNKSSHEANEGIRVLTAITALTFPALVVGGWFGMNFEHMPELHAKHTYPVAWSLMLASTYAIWLFMRRRKWL